MSPIPKPNIPAHLHGLRVRVQYETEVLGHYEACPAAPERIMVRVGGIITIVPVSHIEVLK